MDTLFPGLAATPDLHPLVVHFPIAFWLTATAAWVFALFRSHDAAWRFGLWLHTLGAVSGAVAVVFGYLAADRLGHDSPSHDLVHTHRDLMIAASAMAMVLTVLAWRRLSHGNRWRGLLGVCSIALSAVVAVGADKGGALVYQQGVGVARSAPAHGGEPADHAPAPSTQPHSEHHH